MINKVKDKVVIQIESYEGEKSLTRKRKGAHTINSKHDTITKRDYFDGLLGLFQQSVDTLSTIKEVTAKSSLL